MSPPAAARCPAEALAALADVPFAEFLDLTVHTASCDYQVNPFPAMVQCLY